MRDVFAQLRVIAQSESTVVITGESGTGKEITAALIHKASSRRRGPFVVVSCTLFSDSLIESELFGHERGAFTGAVKDRPGRFELANGGTVFLDDIDDVPLSMQVKLLRVLQNRTVERVGGTKPIAVDVRVLVGAKRDLKQLVDLRVFRDDLYYRLNVLSLLLPPLRNRRDDIPLLMDHFLELYFRRRGRGVPAIAPEVTSAFVRYGWPGNVRELENACERIAQTCTCPMVGQACVAMPGVPERIESAPRPEVTVPHRSSPVFLDERVRELERSLIQWALETCDGNKAKAARLLHVRRSTFADRIRRCGLGVAAAPSRARQLHSRARSPIDRAAPPPPGPVPVD
jgi:transcriptional regulator with GAF, ATPase, and Fis domain